MAMFKQHKRTTVTLLAAVAALWGIIFYRIYTTTADKDMSRLQVQTKKTSYFKMVDHAKDKIVLTLNYPDPFADKAQMMMVSSETAPGTTVVKAPPPPKVQVNWTSINYTGYINNKKNGIRLAIMAVNGKTVTIAEGQDIDGIKLLKYTTDSVKIKYQNETKFIRLK